MNKDIQSIVKKVTKSQGWSVEKSRKNGHYKLYAPDHETIILISSTISDARAIKKIRSDLKRNGLLI